jgi:hypothetical protein
MHDSFQKFAWQPSVSVWAAALFTQHCVTAWSGDVQPMAITTKRSVHQTAQRIVALWQALCHQPMTLDMMQDYIGGLSGQAINIHSIKLYLSTLRLFGCDIVRSRLSTDKPDPLSGKNPTYYRIESHHYLHPLLSSLSLEQLDDLAEAGGSISLIDTQNHWLTWLTQLADWGGLLWQSHQLKAEYVHIIDNAIQTQQLVQLQYQPLSDTTSRLLTCLPLGGYIRRHRHYLRVLVPDKHTPALLRSNRIHHVEPYENEPILKQLQALRRFQPLIEVHFAVPPNSPLPLLPDVRSIEVLPNHQGVAVFMETRDQFLLVQQLLSCGLPFNIVQPISFKQDVDHLLNQLAQQLKQQAMAHG